MGNKLIVIVALLFFLSLGLFSQNLKVIDYRADSIKIEKQLDTIEKYININNHEKAYYFTLSGLKFFKETEYLKGKVKLFQRAATLNSSYYCNLDSSVFYLNEMRNLSSRIKFKRGLLWYEHAIGRVYHIQNDYSKAYKFYKSAYKLALEINDSIGMADILSGLSQILVFNKQYDSSKVCIRKALEISRYYNLYRTDIMLYDKLANIYLQTNQYDSSIYYFNKALETAKKINSRLGVLTMEFNLAYLAYLKTPNNEIVKTLNKLLKETKEEGFLKVHINAGYFLSEILEERKDFEKALNVYKETRAFEDSLIGNERVRKVVERESSFYLNQKEIENQQLQKDAKIRELVLKNRQLIIYFTLFTLIVCIILLRIIYKKYIIIKQNVETIKAKERIIFDQEKSLIQNEKDIIEQKLEIQKREFSGKLMKIYQHQEIAKSIITELNELKNTIKPNSKENKTASIKLQTIINRLNTSDNEQQWLEFEKSFNETNPEYLKRLSEKFPELTPNELKLCIFLNLNLRTKEISVITQQSVKSIDVARTRLRRKLGLDNTNTNISLFLKQI